METRFESPQLPDMPNIVFEHPPLALTLCQIRYNSVLNVNNPSFVASFQDSIKDDYPVASSAPVQEISLQFGNSLNVPNIFSGNPVIQWQFSDVNDNWRVILTQDSFTLETRVYKHFSDFLERLNKVIDKIVKHVQPPNCIRIGLRYVNEIRLSDTPWSEVICKELLGPIVIPEIVNHAVQTTSVQQIQLSYLENQKIVINHGLFPRGTTVRPRQEDTTIEQNFYLLDFDVFREFPSSKAPSLNADIIYQHIEEYHKTISRLFYWSVTQQYLSTLEVK